MGYWNGSAWKTWIDSSGNFYFGGSTGASLRWNGSTLAGYNSSNSAQWYAQASDGGLYAGGGKAAIFRYGYMVEVGPDSPTYTWPFVYGGLHAVSSVTSPATGWKSSIVFGEPPLVYTGDQRERGWVFEFAGDLDNPVLGEGARYSTAQYALTISDAVGHNWRIWHEGNFTPSNYAAKAGATFTGAVTFSNDITVTGNIRSDTAIPFVTTGSAAQQIRAGSVLTSSSFSHSTRVPTNGIYSLGPVAIATSDGAGSGYNLDVSGATRFRASANVGTYLELTSTTSPGTPTGAVRMYYDGTNIKVTIPGGTTRTLSWT
jgi:hypothetical protein